MRYNEHDAAAALDSPAASGVHHVEPAYIVGYTEPLDGDAFTEGAAVPYVGRLAASGLVSAMPCCRTSTWGRRMATTNPDNSSGGLI